MVLKNTFQLILLVFIIIETSIYIFLFKNEINKNVGTLHCNSIFIHKYVNQHYIKISRHVLNILLLYN